MPKVITTLQAMSHPTVVATINCLSEMTQRLQDENDELKAALAQPAQPEEQHSCDKQERPWVSLTREEINSALSKYSNWYNFAAHLENILKEKNQ